MSATFNWAIRNGAGGVSTDLGSSGNLANYKSADDATAADYTSFPIIRGTNSYELFLRAHFSGSFTTVRDIRFWQSTAFSPATGLTVKWSGTQQIYLQPSAVTSSIATSSIPTSDPGTANVSIGGNLSGSLVAAGFTDHIVLQLQTTTAAPPGITSAETVTLTYVEN